MKKSTKILYMSLIFVMIIIFIMIWYVPNMTRYIDVESYVICENRENIHEIQIFISRKKIVINDAYFVNEFINFIDKIPLIRSSEDEIPSDTDRKECSILFFDEYGGRIGNETGWVHIYEENYIQRMVDMKVFKARYADDRIVSQLEVWLKNHGYEFEESW